MVVEDEIDDILRELVRTHGVAAAALVRAGADGPDPAGARLQARREPLGDGLELVALLEPEAPAEVEGGVARTVRELRACLRRGRAAGATAVPDLEIWGRVRRSRAALLRRIARTLEAFAAAHGASGVALVRRGQVVATGGSLEEPARERLPFLCRRIDAEAARARARRAPGEAPSSHAEIVGDDVYARSFGLDAYLVAYFDRPFAVDFVRHRALLITRDLAGLLPHLDADPPGPAAVRPR